MSKGSYLNAVRGEVRVLRKRMGCAFREKCRLPECNEQPNRRKAFQYHPMRKQYKVYMAYCSWNHYEEHLAFIRAGAKDRVEAYLAKIK